MDILNESVRTQVFKEIMQTENWWRKACSYHEMQIYKRKQKKYVYNSLLREYDKETADRMRMFTSINIIPRIISEKASIYTEAPKRNLDNANDMEIEQFNNIYAAGMYNRQLKYSNRYFKYQQQTHVQVLPINGVLKPRVLPSYMLDVVPLTNDPEEGEVFIVPLRYDIGGTGALWQQIVRADSSDGINQIIGDGDDDNLDVMRFAVWTKDYNFMANGKGEIINPETDEPFTSGMKDEDVLSPVQGTKTFIDISEQKDGLYWIDSENSMADFAIDFAKVLSDTVETNKTQGFGIGVISALEKPRSLMVGQNKYMFLKKDKMVDPAKDPTFEFTNPNPDLNASLDLLDRVVNYFLSSYDVDSNTITSGSNSMTFNSGLERFLYMIDKFEASKDDLDVYHGVEQQLFDATRAFNNVLQDHDSFENGNKHGLKESLKGGRIGEEVTLEVVFSRPDSIRTRKEIEDQQIKLKNEQLTTRRKAIMAIHDVNEDGAEQLMQEIQSESDVEMMQMIGEGFGDQ